MINIDRTNLKLKPVDVTLEHNDSLHERYQAFDFPWFKIRRLGFRFWIEPVRYAVNIWREIDV